MEEQKLTGYPGNQKLKEMLQETSLTEKGSICPGVTLLDYFAAKADVSKVEFGSIELLEEFICRKINRDDIIDGINAQFEAISKLKYMEACCMLKEREKHLK